MRRLHVRGLKNVAKRVLLQAAAFNLALILRSITQCGTPRGLAELNQALLSLFVRLLAALDAPFRAPQAPLAKTAAPASTLRLHYKIRSSRPKLNFPEKPGF